MSGDASAPAQELNDAVLPQTMDRDEPPASGVVLIKDVNPQMQAIVMSDAEAAGFVAAMRRGYPDYGCSSNAAVVSKVVFRSAGSSVEARMQLHADGVLAFVVPAGGCLSFCCLVAAHHCAGAGEKHP